MPSARRLLLLLVAAALIARAGELGADIDGDRFSSAEWRVRIAAPKNWQLTEKNAYPSVLLGMVRRAPDGKMLLTAEKLKPGATALDYATRTADLLRRMRFRVRTPQLHSSTGAYLLDSDRAGAYLRQAFLVADGVGYSLTLAAPDNRTRSQHLRAFDYALRSIQIIRPEELAPDEGAEPAAPAADAPAAAPPAGPAPEAP